MGCPHWDSRLHACTYQLPPALPVAHVSLSVPIRTYVPHLCRSPTIPWGPSPHTPTIVITIQTP